jgi:hypothetical protein
MTRPRVVVCFVSRRGWQEAWFPLHVFARVRERLGADCVVVSTRLVGDLA